MPLTRRAHFCTLLLSFLGGVWGSVEVPAQTVGERLPPRAPGGLDIHHINTGRGNAALLVLPDGTTLLIDAGEAVRFAPRTAPQRPNAERTPGQWIGSYVEQALSGESNRRLDYALLTHFHDDHMGGFATTMPLAQAGNYKLTGITAVGESVQILKILDRGWPNYEHPEARAATMMENYRAFLRWQSEHAGLEVERFAAGRADQLVLRHAAEKYPDFEIRNVAVNGEIWTGHGARVRAHFPPFSEIPVQDRPSENMCSVAVRLTYGKFKYFSGGDLTGLPAEGSPSWHDVETPVGRVVGDIDVMLANHHAHHDSTNGSFVSTLRPRVVVISAYSPTHPDIRVLKRLLSTRLYPGPRDIFTTNLFEATRIVIGSDVDRMKSTQGHVVVRVAPGGENYHVVILDDSTDGLKVKALHGPYRSKGAK